MAKEDPILDTRWKPGFCPNPGGKSKEREALRIAGLNYMAERSLRYIQEIEKIADEARSDQVRLKAYTWLAEQVFGKAIQAIQGADGQPLPVIDLLPVLQKLVSKKENLE